MGTDLVKTSPDYIAIGRIRTAHGVRGEIKVEILTDFQERFEPGSLLYVEGEAQRRRVVSARPHKGALLVKLEGLEQRSDVEKLRGRYLLVPRAEAMPLPPDVYYEDELLGLMVETTEGESLGELVDVWWTGANEVYVLQGSYGEILLPAIAEVILEVDIQAGKMVVKLLPGLLPEARE